MSDTEKDKNDLIAEYEPRIAVLARKLSRGSADLYDDLLQVGLMSLIDSADKYDAARGANFSTFALLCANRRMIDEWRRHMRHYGFRADLDDAKNMPDPAEPDTGIRIRDIFKKLAEILSETEKKVFDLKARGETSAAVARALGIDAKAVDNAWQRVRKKIHEQMMN